MNKNRGSWNRFMAANWETQVHATDQKTLLHSPHAN